MKVLITRRIVVSLVSFISISIVATIAIVRFAVRDWLKHPVLYQFSHPWHWLTYGSNNVSGVQTVLALFGLVGVYFAGKAYFASIATLRASLVPLLRVIALPPKGGNSVFRVMNMGKGTAFEVFVRGIDWSGNEGNEIFSAEPLWTVFPKHESRGEVKFPYLGLQRRLVLDIRMKDVTGKEHFLYAEVDQLQNGELDIQYEHLSEQSSDFWRKFR